MKHISLILLLLSLSACGRAYVIDTEETGTVETKDRSRHTTRYGTFKVVSGVSYILDSATGTHYVTNALLTDGDSVTFNLVNNSAQNVEKE